MKRSTKLQAPSSSETSISKLQSTAAHEFWDLGFGIFPARDLSELGFGIWDLEFRRVMRRVFVALLLSFSLPVMAAEASPAQIQFFESRIRPVLADNCYKCHSQQAAKVKGGLLLDTKDGLLKGGENGAVIVPGDPEKSALIKAIRYTDPDLQMPPKDKKLSDAQIADLEAWVKMGAPDPRIASASQKNWKDSNKKHWAWQPVKKSPVPEVKDADW